MSVLSLPEHQCHERPEVVERQLALFRPDCVVGVNRDPAAVAVNFAGDLPLWSDVNGDPMAEAQAKAARGAGDWLINEWYRKLVPVLLRSDRFSTCSLAQKHALIGQLGMLGRLVARNDGYDFVSAIPNSIDDDELQTLERIERRLRRPNERFVLLASGGFNTWFDPDLLYDALELVMVEAAQVRFVCTGGAIEGHHTESYARFEERVLRSPFRERFELAGWIKSSELPTYYACADAAILVDRFGYEGVLGARTRMLDWLAAGLPIVSTRLSEISLELEAAGIAVTAPCGDTLGLRDAIRRLLTDPKEALERSQRGRRFVREHYRARLGLEPLLSWVQAPERAPAGEARIDLEWKSSAAGTLRRQATLLRSHWVERGPASTLTAAGRFAIRRLANGAARMVDRIGDEETSRPPALKGRDPTRG